MNIREDKYQTKNLNLASFLLTTGKVELLEVDKTDPKKIWFVFCNQKFSTKLEQQYWKGKALVDPKALCNSMNELKDQMFN